MRSISRMVIWFLARLIKGSWLEMKRLIRATRIPIGLFRGDINLSLGNLAKFPEGPVDLHGGGLVAVDDHAQGLGLIPLPGQVDVTLDFPGEKELAK